MDKFFALSEEKQITIINAALQCFGKFGYDKASVNDIAVTARISVLWQQKTTVYLPVGILYENHYAFV